MKYFRIDLNKNTKLSFYLKNILKMAIPSFVYQKKLDNIINNYKDNIEVQKRVNYYNKLNNKFNINSLSIDDFKNKEKKKTYYFDLLEYIKYFKQKYKINYLFGDIVDIPKTPTILKSRPIDGDNQNSILMKLNKVRHFIFVNDKIKFKDKKDILVWRGKCYVPHRIEFIKKFYNKQYCNVGQTNTKGDIDVPWQKDKLSLTKQLEYKFILAIEGNDVASNLKWIMSSNSIAFMTKPKFETWFMEGTLIEDYHYVLIKDDYSNLEEKINYYSKNIYKALEIIKNANHYTKQFQNKKQEDAISLLVLDKYFKLSKQKNQENK